MPKKTYKSNMGGGGGGRIGRSSNPNSTTSYDDSLARFSQYLSRNSNYSGNRPSGSSTYSGNRPRVSFKNQPIKLTAKRDFKRLEYAAKSHLNDDVVMSSGSNTNNNNNNNNNNSSSSNNNDDNTNNGRRIVFRGRGRSSLIGGRRSPLSQRGSRLPNNQNRSKPMTLHGSSWYKVHIMFGHEYEKDFIINSLLSHMAPDTFIPIMYKIIGQDAIFYVDDQKAANKLLNADRRITTADGFKIRIKVRPGFPNCDVDSALEEKLKLAMAKRYVVHTNALDLSQFHHDPELVSDHFCALFRPMMLISVLNIVSDTIPNLHALNLSNNKLHIIERLNVLSKKFPNLKILYLGDNKIKEINQLDVLKELNLEELQLKGNPVCDKYKTRQDDYVSDVRKRFPKLLRLDGVELPKPIFFDVVDEEVKLPSSKMMFSGDPRAEKVAIQFMQQYFTIFDSDSRQPLLDAYHENTCFSLTVAPGPQTQKFHKYMSNNRNLLRSNDPARRRKLLKQGRLPVVSYISELPKTQHYLNSFTMDISLVTDVMMLITITGCFKELDMKDQPIRSFNRTFIIVPEGTGYCIKNEQLHLAHPTPGQEKQALNNAPVSAPSNIQNQPQPHNVATNSGSATTVSMEATTETTDIGEPSVELQQQMTIMLSQQTNMNMEWSLKCLKEVQWNYNTALAAFNDFFKRGEIPPAAFQK